MTEAEYRALEIDSYSTLKVFVEDRKKYYRKFVLKELVKEDETASTTFGSLVDCLLFSPYEFEERYTLAVSQVPTGQYGKFVDELMKVTLRSLNEDGEVTRDIDDMMLQAYNAVKYDSAGNVVDFKRDGFEVVKSKFFGTELEMRYRELRESYGKTIIELKDVENATAVVNELKSNFATKRVMTQVSDERFDVYHQLPIIGDINGYPMKCLVDKLVADNQKRIIFPIDFKTAWDNENEFITNYFKYKYYIQNVVYYLLVVQWVNKHEKYKGYYVEFPRFIAAEANNYKNPLIYTTSLIHHKEGRDGFKYKEKWHMGIAEAIEDLKWHKNTGIWNISKKNFENNGVVELPSFEYLNTA